VDTAAAEEKPFWPVEWVTGVFYALVLLWVNFHVGRDFFRNESAPANSMHGFWPAIANRADGAWFHAAWWPYWDCGIPFELTYAPGVPFLTAVVEWVRHVPPLLAFNTVSGIAYCAAPLTSFVMGWWMMRSPGYAFVAALVYSLTSATQLIAPDAQFAWRGFWDARRVYVTAVWDDTPHLAAVALIPLIVLFLSLSIRKRRVGYYAAAAVCIALASLCSAFGPTDTAMAALCLLFVLHRERLAFNIALVAGIGAYAWAMTAPFLSPGVITAIGQSSHRDGTGWSEGSYTAVALVVLGWAIVWQLVRRWTPDWRLRFFALFAYLTASVPMIAEFLNRQFLPQPKRYKLEMEMALVVFAVFALRPVVEKMPRSIRAGLLLVLLGFGGEQITNDRKFAKIVLAPANPAASIESRASVWAERNLPGVRVSMPQWGTLYSRVPQFSGGSWSMAYNPAQQVANDGVQAVEDSREPLLWLKAYGVGAVCAAGPKSPEFWKSMHYPQKFDGLKVLWREDDTTIFEVPRRSSSLAHVVPVGAVVGTAPRDHADLEQVARYVAALEDARMPEAAFRWEGNNRFVVGVPAGVPAGEMDAVSVQVSWHPGWHARIGDRKLAIGKDGLGLMWIRPGCAGGCEVRVEYDGGWGLRLLRWLSFGAIAGLVGGLLWAWWGGLL
jgi:hypothetical protein